MASVCCVYAGSLLVVVVVVCVSMKSLANHADLLPTTLLDSQQIGLLFFRLGLSN